MLKRLNSVLSRAGLPALGLRASHGDAGILKRRGFG